MKIYQIDVKVAATAYIVAEDEAEAQKLFDEHFAQWNDDLLPKGGIVNGDNFATLIEHGKEDGSFVSISPVVTYHGHWGDPATAPDFELTYEEGEDEGIAEASPPDDFDIIDAGSLIGIKTLSEAGKAWMDEHVQAEGWQWLGDILYMDKRFAFDLIAGMREDGLRNVGFED